MFMKSKGARNHKQASLSLKY